MTLEEREVDLGVDLAHAFGEDRPWWRPAEAETDPGAHRLARFPIEIFAAEGDPQYRGRDVDPCDRLERELRKGKELRHVPEAALRLARVSEDVEGRDRMRDDQEGVDDDLVDLGARNRNADFLTRVRWSRHRQRRCENRRPAEEAPGDRARRRLARDSAFRIPALHLLTSVPSPRSSASALRRFPSALRSWTPPPARAFDMVIRQTWGSPFPSLRDSRSRPTRRFLRTHRGPQPRRASIQRSTIAAPAHDPSGSSR